MRHTRATQYFATRLVSFFVVALIVAPTALTQQSNSRGSLAKSYPLLGWPRTPIQQGTGNFFSAGFVGHPQSSKFAPDSPNPLLLPPVSYNIGGGSSGLVIGDVNGDGKVDVIAIDQADNQDGSVWVILGNGDGTFQSPLVYDSGGQYPGAISIGDVNGDGKADLIISNSCPTGGYNACYAGPKPNSIVSVLLGNGDGTFQPAVSYSTGGYGGGEPLVADLNADGKADIVVLDECITVTSNGQCGLADGAVSVLLGNGDGTFRPATASDSGGWGPLSIVVTDVNGDRIPDLVVGNTCGSNAIDSCSGVNADGNASVFLGNGDGTFQPAVTYDDGCQWTEVMTVTDVNGDGRPDILLTSFIYSGTDAGYLSVLLNQGNGTFTLSQVITSGGAWPLSFAVADLNTDGYPDVVAANYGSSNVGILLNNGHGFFDYVGNDPSGAKGGDNSYVAVADMNGDGHPDILVTNNPCASECPSSVGLLLGHGDGHFEPTQLFSTGGDIARIFAVDLNGDGKLDALTWNALGDPDNVLFADIGVLLNNTVRPYNPSSTTLASSQNPAPPNQLVTYTATVSSQTGGSATGTVTFYDGKNVLGTVPLTNDQASYSTTYKPTGHHAITASYSGDANNGFSASAVLTEDIAPLPVLSTTVVTSSGSPSLLGQQVTFTATVAWAFGSIPNGELVTFYDGTTVLGTATTANSAATFTTSSLSVKSHIIKATYAGDSSFKSSSGTFKQVVTAYPTSTSLSSNPNPSTYWQVITFTAKVATTGPVPPTGKVSLSWSNGLLGTGTLNSSGLASITVRTLNVGSYAVTAEYKGDANNAPSSSSSLNQVVQQATSTTTLTSSPNPSTLGQAVTFTAKVTSPTAKPAGPVTFTAGNTTLGTVDLSSGKAAFTTSSLPSGSTVVTAKYAGDSNIGGSSASVTQVVH